MPLIINDGLQAPDHWATHEVCGSWKYATVGKPNTDVSDRHVRIALINNMPDAALEDTEHQFFSLLQGAAKNHLVNLQLYHLPEVPRGERVQHHLARFYRPVDQLWQQRFDGAIITGTEPRQRDLRDEPYWKALTSVFDWAETHTVSTVLSCLAAHASVLHSDGIDRHALEEKQFGVFDFQRIEEHELTAGLPRVTRFPHSRWNEVQADVLVAHGYTVLDQSRTAGVNLFIKQKQQSLFVHFQGHPEYGSHTLLKEYRRDVRRFLRQERPSYPLLPYGYFDTFAANLLTDFQTRAELQPVEETLSTFPDAVITETLKNSWGAAAHSIYQNWLELITSQKASDLKKSVLTPFANT